MTNLFCVTKRNFSQMLILFFLNIFAMLVPAVVVADMTNMTTFAQAAFDKTVGEDLLLVQKQESAQKSSSEIYRMNADTFTLLNHYRPRPSQNRAQTISLEFAELVLKSINLHPVVSDYAVYDYRNGMSIGFCFGRATYVHLALLRAGVNKLSLKKVWAVGPMATSDTDWQFHVATAVLAEDGKWYAIDTFVGQVVSVETWFARMQQVAKDDTLRFYVSSPSKFSVSLGTYSRVELGLDLSSDQDWYSHYFKKLMSWMSLSPLSDVGLYDIRIQK